MRHRPVRRPLGRMFARPYFFSEAHSRSQHHSILSVMNVHSPPSITVKYPRSKRPCLPRLLQSCASASRAQLACHGGHAGRTRPHSSPGTSGHEAATPRSGATAAARRLRARPLARAWRVALWEGAILVLALQGTTRALERRNAPRPKTRSLASAFCGIVLDPAQGLPRRSHARRAVAPHRNRHRVCPAQSRPNASLRPLPGRQLQRRWLHPEAGII